MPRRAREARRVQGGRVSPPAGEGAATALDAPHGLGYEGLALISQQMPRERHMSVDTSHGHPAMDYAEHTRTYKGFLRATVILIVLVVCILVYLYTLVP
jgi:hypothetical protein